MLAYHFTEMPYPYVPDEVERALNTTRVIVPNGYCDPAVAADLYSRYLDEYEYAEDIGLEIMLNEHHQTMTNLVPSAPLAAAALARRTKRAKIAIVGSPLPQRDNPLRVAEEIAMLDCISRGRIISGFVRGVPSEIYPSNTNPVLTRERFEEAHDLIVKAWTTREPFNWEGRHWHYRYVNVWPRPLQQPHPPIWVTGSSPESPIFAADHQHTYAIFLTPFERTAALIESYRARCEERGFPPPGPDKFAYLCLSYTAETDEQAQEEGRALMWYPPRASPPMNWMPPGYLPAKIMAKPFMGMGEPAFTDSFETLQAKGIAIVGNPDTMIKKITYLYEQSGIGIGHLLMMNHAGAMPADKTRRSMELFAKEVYPAIKHLGEQAVPPSAEVRARRPADFAA